MFSRRLQFIDGPVRSTLGRLGPLGLVVILAGSTTFASPITYTMTATATGTFAGTTFTDAEITVTSVADTADVLNSGSYNDQTFGCLSCYEVLTFTTSISITGFAQATFTDPTFWEDPNGSGDIIFGNLFGDLGTGILGFTKLFAGLETYNLESSFGPVSYPLDFETSIFGNFVNIPTSEGALSLVASNDTFTAVVATPEPSSFLIAALGVLGLIALRHARNIHIKVREPRFRPASTSTSKT